MKTKVLLGTTFVLTTLMVSAGAFQGNGQSAAKSAGGNQTVSSWSGQAVFRDASTDAVTSDGKGVYVDGQAGVFAEFQLNASDGRIQFVVKFAKSRGVSRFINVAYTDPVVTACNPSVSTNPTGTTTISSNGVVFGVQNIGTMALGSTVAKQSEVNASGIGFDFKDPTIADSDVCSDLVVVTRTSGTSWTVTTDAPLSTYLNSNGTTVYNANPEEVGATAQGSDSAGFVGNYRLPYQVIVSCIAANTTKQPNNCPNPQ